MYQLIFNEPATEKDKSDLHSFVRTLNNLMKKFDTERITKIFFMFSKLLWGPGAQGISAFDPKEDEEVKNIYLINSSNDEFICPSETDEKNQSGAYDDLLKQLSELKDENDSLKQLLEVYHIYLKGGEEDGSRRHETIK